MITLDNISRTYAAGEQEVRALDGVSLTIRAGEFVAIMGQSGSGKSTLMNVIGCLDQPTGGRYTVRGRDVKELSSDELAHLRRDTFGFIFQRYNLLAGLTAQENVEVPAVYAACEKHERQMRAHALLEKLGLSARGHHRPSELSGGQQQRVAIARALMNDPPIILADEPTGALDSKSGAEVMALLKKLHADGRTIILITHDAAVASNAQRVLHIADGKIVREEVLSESTAREAAAQNNQTIDDLASAREAVSIARNALRVNIFRTALTLLGIVIGVASVVAMLAIGDGSKQKVLDQISAMGTNLLNVQPGAPNVRGSDAPATLTLDDAQAVSELSNVAAVLPLRSGRVTARYSHTDYATSAQGVGADLPFVRDWDVAEGRFFSQRDQRSGAPVAVLGQTVKNILFPGGDSPVGKYILLKNIPFEIIGVMASKGASGFGGDQDDAVFVPVTTALTRLFGQSHLNNLTVRVDDLAQIDDTQSKITELLKTRHRTEDFRLRNMASIIDSATQTQDTLTVLLGAIAAISLLVGGIGVMNIMLVSVTERTREIGIRMAAGARKRDILLQFNIEAIVVCATGGAIGLALGFAAGFTAEAFGMSVLFSVAPAVLAFASAFLTGVVFGYLPARKAANLDPVAALATE